MVQAAPFLPVRRLLLGRSGPSPVNLQITRVFRALSAARLCFATDFFVSRAAGSDGLSLSDGTNSYFFFHDTRLSVLAQKRVKEKQTFALLSSRVTDF